MSLHRALMRPELPVVVALAIGAGACGDPAADVGFGGEPLESLRCTVASNGYTAPLGVTWRVTLLWQRPDGAGFVEGATDADVATTFPASVVLDLLQAPHRELDARRADASGAVAVGVVAAYEDRDDDGRWDEDERLVGGARHRVVAYVRDHLVGMSARPLAAGFHHLVPESCSYPDRPRFSDLPVGDCVVSMDGKFVAWFDLECPPVDDGACADLAAARAACRADANDARCALCAAGIFPLGATPDACDAWLEGCLAAFPDGGCEGEWKSCRAGDEGPPPCDDACVCEGLYTSCMQATDIDPAVCTEKRAACYAATE